MPNRTLMTIKWSSSSAAHNAIASNIRTASDERDGRAPRCAIHQSPVASPHIDETNVGGVLASSSRGAVRGGPWSVDKKRAFGPPARGGPITRWGASALDAVNLGIGSPKPAGARIAGAGLNLPEHSSDCDSLRAREATRLPSKFRPCHANTRCRRLGGGHPYACGPLLSQASSSPTARWGSLR
jgi:hypothetical protein